MKTRHITAIKLFACMWGFSMIVAGLMYSSADTIPFDHEIAMYCPLVYKKQDCEDALDLKRTLISEYIEDSIADYEGAQYSVSCECEGFCDKPPQTPGMTEQYPQMAYRLACGISVTHPDAEEILSGLDGLDLGGDMAGGCQFHPIEYEDPILAEFYERCESVERPEKPGQSVALLTCPVNYDLKECNDDAEAKSRLIRDLLSRTGISDYTLNCGCRGTGPEIEVNLVAPGGAGKGYQNVCTLVIEHNEKVDAQLARETIEDIADMYEEGVNFQACEMTWPGVQSSSACGDLSSYITMTDKFELTCPPHYDEMSCADDAEVKRYLLDKHLALLKESVCGFEDFTVECGCKKRCASNPSTPGLGGDAFSCEWSVECVIVAKHKDNVCCPLKSTVMEIYDEGVRFNVCRIRSVYEDEVLPPLERPCNDYEWRKYVHEPREALFEALTLGLSQSLQHVPYRCIKAKPVWISDCDCYMKNGETGGFDFMPEVEYTRLGLAITEPMEGSLVGAGNQITVRGVVEGAKTVTVNEIEATIHEDGTWSAQITLPETPGELTLQATAPIGEQNLDAVARFMAVTVKSLEASLPSTGNSIERGDFVSPDPGIHNVATKELDFEPDEAGDLMVVMRNAGTVTVTAIGVDPPAAVNRSDFRWHVEPHPNNAVSKGKKPELISPTGQGLTGEVMTFHPDPAGSFLLINYLDADLDQNYDKGEELRVLPFAIVQAELLDSKIETWGINTEDKMLGIRRWELVRPNMKLSADFKVEGGGPNRSIGVGHVHLENVGNLVKQTLRVFYSKDKQNFVIEDPDGRVRDSADINGNFPAPMVDASDGPFRSSSEEEDLSEGVRKVTSNDVPGYTWPLEHPVSGKPWISTAGQVAFREYIVAYTNTFLRNYVALAQGCWTAIINGKSNPAGSWDPDIGEGVRVGGKTVNPNLWEMEAELASLVTENGPTPADKAGVQVHPPNYVDSACWIAVPNQYRTGRPFCSTYR